MDIIKHGRLTFNGEHYGRDFKFICGCGCEFTCKESELNVLLREDELHGERTRTYLVKCPDCNSQLSRLEIV